MNVLKLSACVPVLVRTQCPSLILRIAALVMVILTPFSRTMAADSALTINEAVRLAAERAPMLLARQSSRVAASEELVRSDALPDPTLTFGVQNLPIGGQDAFTVSRDRMTMRRIGLSQALPSRSKRDARREFAHARLEQADAEALATALDIKRAAARAWVQLWAAEKERDLLDELRDQAGLSVQATQARLRGGSGSASDALAARSSELELQNRIDEADARIEQAHAGLERWLGVLPDKALAPPPDFSRAPFQEAELLADLDRQGPLLTWEAREAAADAALSLARAEKRPDWSIGAGVARRGAGASNVIWLEVGVGLPLFSGNRQDRGISARTADLDAIRASREDARRMQAESVRKDFARWEGLIRQEARLRDTLLPLSGDRSRTALAAYAGGASLQAWLDARRDEIDTRIDYADVLARWGQAWVELAYLLPDTDVDSAHSPNIPETTR